MRSKSKTEKSSPKERTVRGLREDQERTGRGLGEIFFIFIETPKKPTLCLTVGYRDKVA